MTHINHNLPPVKSVPTFGNIAVGTMFTIPGAINLTYVKLATRGKYANATRCVSHPELGDGNFTEHCEIQYIVTRVEFYYD